jgi:hypothetical protein
MLYVPTQDLPVEVESSWSGFDWMQEGDIYAAHQAMPLLELLTHHQNEFVELDPRIQIELGDQKIEDVLRLVYEKENFISVENSSQPEQQVEAVPPFLKNFYKTDGCY